MVPFSTFVEMFLDGTLTSGSYGPYSVFVAPCNGDKYFVRNTPYDLCDYTNIAAIRKDGSMWIVVDGIWTQEENPSLVKDYLLNTYNS